MSYTAAKARLLRSIGREVRDARVLDAIRDVPRELFVPPELAAQAYDDVALSIGEGQTISQPLMVAIMLQALDAQATDTVLDVGTGSGYQAALLSHLAAHVVGVERIPVLIERARAALGEAGATNVDVREAGPVPGAPELAPFDRIVVGAAAPSVPSSLVEQLRLGGRLVIPVGTPFEQRLAQVTRTLAGRDVRWLGACRFVPLIGDGGWPADMAGAPGV
ncbi:MAG: protein-L-isoaspartate(D-aspartate) O-methyltransferase [Chloroflexi bacterium]|nr:protein-L-isoaspartate(D-aspartate) O-methyltransferase [Chloroflexota bacterium]MCH7655991.1 protein-L-isoaspartate(D-aspartate) O-methyltransferase [Chloroflexota bacterium]